MKEIALHIMDIAQNSISAGATLIEIEVSVDHERDAVFTSVKDNGCGMDEETVGRVVSPFETSRTTRKVGLGIPFLRWAQRSAEEVLSLAPSRVRVRISALPMPYQI